MTGVALLLIAAAAAFGLARALRLPSIPFLVLAGLGLSYAAGPEAEFVRSALVLGITFLVFVAGIELNPRRVRRQRRAAITVGIAQFVFLGGVGFVAARALGMGSQSAAYVGLALTASSTLIVVRILQQRQQLHESFGRLVIGVLLLQDLTVILLVPVLTRMQDGSAEVLRGVGATLVLVGAAYVLLRWILPRVLRRISLDAERLLLAVLALLFVFLFLSDILGVPLIAGAFLAGVSLSSFPVNGVVRGQLTSIGDFFTAIFFTALGASLGLPTPEQIVQAMVLSLVVLFFTPPLVALVAQRAGFSARPAILSGLLLSQTSEFSLVIAIQGLALGQISAGTFEVITLVTLVTMTVAPFLATDSWALRLMRFHPARPSHAHEEAERPTGHVLLLGCGMSGMPLLETLVINPHKVVVIDDDPGIVHRVRESGVEAIRGDAADLELLQRAGASRARVVVSTLRRVEDNEPLLRMVGPDVPVLVRAFNVEDAEWVRSHGGTAVLYSDAAAESFLDWFDRGGGATPDDSEDEEREQVL